MVIVMQRARTVAKETTLRVVPDDPGIDEVAMEPSTAPLEQDAVATRSEPAAHDSSAVTAAERVGEAEELVEALRGTV
jgi:hypothetical protein